MGGGRCIPDWREITVHTEERVGNDDFAGGLCRGQQLFQMPHVIVPVDGGPRTFGAHTFLRFT